MRKKKIKTIAYLNKQLLVLTILLAVAGAFFILNASSISSTLTYGYDSPYHFFYRQLLFITLSLILSLIIIKIDTRHYKLLSLFIIVPSLILSFINVFKNNNATSDISQVVFNIGSFSIQPAEFLKTFVVMYMGAFYGSWANREKHKSWTFIIPLIVCALSFLFILICGDWGSAAIMAALFVLTFACVPAKGKKDKIVRILQKTGVVCLIFGLLFMIFGYLIIPEDKLNGNSRLSRFNYKNACDRYEENSGYQVCNGYIAINNGGLKGGGIGSSVQKYLYLPESHTDFIFPIIIEEFGAIAGIIILFIYMAILYFTFKVATNCYKLQNSIICYGIGIYFLLHIFVNLGGVLGLIPLTGVPLPFLSYGGSFCIAMICSFAVVQRINIENVAERKFREANSE